MIPYGRHQLDALDVEAVAETLRSDWLTTGPAVERFETAVRRYTGAAQAVAVINGTAALHVMLAAAGIGPEHEVVVPAITFAATANAVFYCGGTPVIADVDPETLLLTPETLAPRLTPRTRAVVAVDYAGQPCDYAALAALCDARGIMLFADACHALGGADAQGRRVGTLARATCFSFHPVKHVTTGEGGMVVTDDPDLAATMRRLRNHGMDLDQAARNARQAWRYDVAELGWNYRLSDIACALGASQMTKLEGFLEQRLQLADRYDAKLRPHMTRLGLRPLSTRPGLRHARHLYVVRIAQGRRDAVFARMREAGIGVNVHYWPVHLHSLFRRRLGTGEGLCPQAEAAAQEILSLPLHPGLDTAQQDFVLETLEQSLQS